MCRTAALVQPPPLLFELSSPTTSPFELPVSPALLPLEAKLLETATEPNPVGPTRRSGLHFEYNDNGLMFKDETYAREVTDRVVQLIYTAMTPDTSSINTHLAKKALKYRNVGMTKAHGRI
ncbi:hypothetical protein PHMEG_0008568 [Phytophthora megakarya]|uniref:Uncharacterized protein n=1 Tax=Phytophthora megakarya TaxID=4795 RepID=A0A225WK30_9STRA|nr:hypothetical protein PHMEG_0008568 [Phytophthora megakarya]